VQGAAILCIKGRGGGDRDSKGTAPEPKKNPDSCGKVTTRADDRRSQGALPTSQETGGGWCGQRGEEAVAIKSQVLTQSREMGTLDRGRHEKKESSPPAWDDSEMIPRAEYITD